MDKAEAIANTFVGAFAELRGFLRGELQRAGAPRAVVEGFEHAVDAYQSAHATLISTMMTRRSMLIVTFDNKEAHVNLLASPQHKLGLRHAMEALNSALDEWYGQHGACTAADRVAAEATR